MTSCKTLLAVVLIAIYVSTVPLLAQEKASDIATALLIRLNSEDQKEVDAAVEDLQDMLVERPGLLGSRLIEALAKAGRFQTLAEMAEKCAIARADDTEAVASLTAARVRAFAGMKKYEEALAAAKAFYNVAPMKNTPRAIEMLAVRLRDARRDSDPTIVERFQLEQAAGAADATQPAAGVLASIKIDPSPWLAGLKARKAKNPVADAMAEGNLMLLADRPEAARKAFITARDLSQGRPRNLAIEGIARSIRAADGATGRANAFMQSAAKKPTTVPAGM